LEVQFILDELRTFARDPTTRALTQSEFFESIVDRVERAEQLNRGDLITLERDASELSFTGQVVSRTRKRDVFPDRPQRRAIVVPVRFSAEERYFYDAVSELCRL